MSTSIKSLAKDTVIYGISHVLPRIMNYIVLTPYLTYKFGEVDNGKYSIVYTYVTILLAFMTFRMDTAYFRFANNRPKEEKDRIYATALTPVIVISGIVLMVIGLNSAILASWVGLPGDGRVLQWMVGVLVFDALTTLMYSRFRLDMRPLKFMVFRFLNVIAILGLLLFFLEGLPRISISTKLWLDQLWGVQSDLDYTYIANLCASGVVLIAMLPDMLNINYSLDRKLLGKFLGYSWPLTLVAIAAGFNQYFPIPLISSISNQNGLNGQAQAGLFSAGLKLSILLNLCTTAYNYAAEPFFFNNSKTEEGKLVYGKAALAFTLFAVITVLGIYLYIDIFERFVGPRFRSGLIVVPVLLLANVFLGLYYNVSMWYKLADRTIIGLWIAIAGVIVTIASCYLLVPTIGIMGGAWATFLCYLIMLILSYYQGQKHYPLDYPVKKIVGYIALTMVVLLISYVARSYWNFNLVSRLTLNTLLFTATSAYIGKVELWPLMSEFMKRKKR